MPLSKEEKAARRAQAAGPHPKPRGKAPTGTNGLPKIWDKENGGWNEDLRQPPLTWAQSLVQISPAGLAGLALAPAPPGAGAPPVSAPLIVVPDAAPTMVMPMAVTAPPVAATPPVSAPVSAAPPVALPPIAVPIAAVVAPPVTPLIAAPHVATPSCATLSVAAPPVAAPLIHQTVMPTAAAPLLTAASVPAPALGSASELPASGPVPHSATTSAAAVAATMGAQLDGAPQFAAPPDVLPDAPPDAPPAVPAHPKPRGRAPTVGVGDDAEEAMWDEQIGCWRTPGGSVYEVQRYKKRKLNAEAQRELCERIDSEAVVASGGLMPHATAACHESTFKFRRSIGRGNDPSLPTKLLEINLCTTCGESTIERLFNRLPCFHCNNPQSIACARSGCPTRSWSEELQSALEGASTGCLIDRGCLYGGRVLVVMRYAAYREAVDERLEGSGLSRAQHEGFLRHVLEEKVRKVATELLPRRAALLSEAHAAELAASRAHREREAAERARNRADREEQLMLQIHEHGACARCGYDGAGDEPYRRALSIWEGQCRHGFWPGASAGSDPLRRSHECYCCDHAHVMHSGYQRFRCRQCGWEVPSFLCAEPEPQPAVPLSAQLPMGEVHVAPLLAVGYPEPQYWTDSHGQRRLDMCTGAQGKSKPIVRVRLRVFTSAAQAPTPCESAATVATTAEMGISETLAAASATDSPYAAAQIAAAPAAPAAPAAAPSLDIPWEERPAPPPLDASLLDADIPSWRSPTDCGVGAHGWIHYWVESERAYCFHHAPSGRSQRGIPPKYHETYNAWLMTHSQQVSAWLMRGWAWRPGPLPTL